MLCLAVLVELQLVTDRHRAIALDLSVSRVCAGCFVNSGVSGCRWTLARWPRSATLSLTHEWITVTPFWPMHQGHGGPPGLAVRAVWPLRYQRRCTEVVRVLPQWPDSVIRPHRSHHSIFSSHMQCTPGVRVWTLGFHRLHWRPHSGVRQAQRPFSHVLRRHTALRQQLTRRRRVCARPPDQLCLWSRVVASTQSFKYQYKYQYLSLKYQYQYQYPCLKYKYKYQYFGSNYQYQ